MIDITKQQDKKPFLWKEFAVNVLIAFIPASFIAALLKMAGVRGALLPLILIFGGAAIVGKIRKNKGKVATTKNILFWLLIDIVIFIFAPIIFIAYF